MTMILTDPDYPGVSTVSLLKNLDFQGGLKAVVWTDTIQTVIMFGALTITVVIGTARVGGVLEVWKRSSEGGRIEFFE